MKEFKVYQTQHRLKLDKELAEFAADGWELVGPLQFQIYRDAPAATYYLATFQRDV